VNKFLNIIIILLIAAAAQAQVYQAYVDAADQAFATEDYRSAVSYYGEAIEMEEETEPEMLSKYATAALKYKAYSTAESAFKKMLKVDDAELTKEAYYQLAEIRKIKGDYQGAKLLLDKYFLKEDTNETRKSLAKQSMEDINWALSLKNSNNIKVERLEDEVNTEYSDMSPSFHEGILYYASNNHYASSESIKPYSKIYAYENGESKLLDSPINNTELHAGHYTLNNAGTTIYFTQCSYDQADIKCKIYSQKVGDEDSIKELPLSINATGAHTTQPNLGLDPKTGEEVLYFASDRIGGKGGMDIYYAPMQNGNFTGPYAAESINTAGDDMSPFYHAGSDRLYFSTNGRKSLGGFDIYSASNSASWGEITNLGAGINTGYDEAFYYLNAEGTQAYFASNRIGSEFIDKELEACCYDIYSAALELLIDEVLVKLFDQSNLEPLPGVALKLNGTQADTVVFYEVNDKEYQVNLNRNIEYTLDASKLGYELASLKIPTGEKEAEKKIYLNPISLNMTGFVLNEDKEKLGDYVYTITPVGENERPEVKVGADKKIRDKITKHKDYTIAVEKEGYYPETVVLKMVDNLKKDILDLDIILKKIPDAVLTKITLDGYLPLPLFFDNDEPDNNTRSTQTAQTYHQTYSKYFARLPQFVQENTEGLNQERKLDAESNIRSFFQTKVKYGDDSLDAFTEHLLNFLEQGSQAEIMLRGYASPRFRSDYNDALTSRRVRSVENHFYQWRGGALVQYINAGQLKLTERPLGESQAPASVSDKLSDKKASIYSVEASNERRVEILEITSSNVSQY